MGKRNNNKSSRQQHHQQQHVLPDMDKFDDSGRNNNGTGRGHDQLLEDEDDNEYGIVVGGKSGGGGGGSGSGGGGSGMSRAAKKRAKKRAKTQPVSEDSNVETATTATAEKGGESEEEDNEPSTKKKKIQLPLDDGFSDAEEEQQGQGGGQDLLGAARQFLKQANKKQKKKKDDAKAKKTKKKKSVADEDVDVDINESDINLASKKKSTTIKKTTREENNEDGAMDDDNNINNINDVGDDDGDLEDIMEEGEMEPELEAMLSTLTPLQILLLDENNTINDEQSDLEMAKDGDQKPSANANATKGDADADADADADEEMPPSATEAEAVGQEVDPLMLIRDLTTEHRAKILLASLLSPSGVTIHDFYNRYWGKRPLLAAFEDDDANSGEEGKAKATNTNPNKQQQDSSGSNSNNEEAIQHATRLDGFLNRSIIHEMILQNKLRYGLDLNVTKYTDSLGNGMRHRITLDPPPKKRKHRSSSYNHQQEGDNADEDDLEYILANPQDIWSNIDTSHCTLRLLRPHEHNDTIHTLLSLLESEFGCMVGSNAYLTPLHSQGFAPHYDDVDVFILQLEGYKRWRVYAPSNKAETLPRESSRDYTEKEVEEEMGCELIMDVVIGPGDVLYLPRGWIHQAETVARPDYMVKLPDSSSGSGKGKGKGDIDGPGGHSLHLTVSAMQNWCWADFLEILMPEALDAAAASEKSISLREGLPRNFLSYMGTMHQVDDEEGGPEGLKQALEAAAAAARGEVDEEAIMEAAAKQRIKARQNQFKEEAKKRIMRVCKQAMSMLDDACDQIGKRFLSDRLPPALFEPELSLTKESSSMMTAVGGASVGNPHHDPTKKIWPNTLCRLVRPNIARLVVEDDKAVLYHCLDNSRVYHGTPLSPMEFEIDDAPALEQLLTTVEPHWIMVKDLLHGDVEDKMEIAQALYDEGILATMLMEAPDRSVQTG